MLAARRALASCGRGDTADAIPVEFPCVVTGRVACARPVIGRVSHRRVPTLGNEVSHNFSYKTYQFDFDLRRLPAGFVREDHFGDVNVTMDTAVRQALADRVGLWPLGAIVATMHLRAPWVPVPAFNPISTYLAHDETGAPCALLCEVHNTPWEERCLYAMRVVDGNGALEPAVHKKIMHVSPFNPPPSEAPNHEYHFNLKLTKTARTLRIDLVDGDGGKSSGKPGGKPSSKPSGNDNGDNKSSKSKSSSVVGSGGPADGLTANEGELRKLKVVQLRKALTDRGASTTGKKDALVRRLSQLILAETGGGGGGGAGGGAGAGTAKGGQRALIVATVWSIPTTGSSHAVGTGGLWAMARVYFQAVTLLLKGAVTRKHVNAPRTPMFFALAGTMALFAVMGLIGVAWASVNALPLIPFCGTIVACASVQFLARKLMSSARDADYVVSILHAAYMTYFALRNAGYMFPGSGGNPFGYGGVSGFAEGKSGGNLVHNAVAADVIIHNAIFAGYLANDFFMSPMAIDVRVHHVLFFLASLVNGASAQMPFTFLWLIVGEASTVPLGLSKIGPEKWRSTLKMIFLVVFVGVRCVLYPVGLLDTTRRIWLHNEVATASSYGVVALLAVGLLVNLRWAKIILSRAGDELSTMALRGMFNRFCAGAKFTPAAARGASSASPSKGDAEYEVIESAEGQLALAPGKLSPGRFFYNLVRGGDNYLGEAYVRGEWFAGRGGDNDGSLIEEGDALARLLRKLTGFLEASESLGAWAALLPSTRKRKADLNKSVGDMNIEQAETSVAAHYDVDQEALLYKTFLDPGMVVSVDHIHVCACTDRPPLAVSQYHAYT